MKMGRLPHTLTLLTLGLAFCGTHAFAQETAAGTSFSGFFKPIFGSHSEAIQTTAELASDADEEDEEPSPAKTSVQVPNAFAQKVQGVQFHAPSVPAPAQINTCSEMQIGESRYIDVSTLPLTIGIPYPGPGYLLKRVDDSAGRKANYEVALNIEFIPKSGESPSLAPQMLDLISRCYANLPGLDDGQGHRLSIRLVKPGEVAPLRKISLTGIKLLREDMLDWSTQSTCRTIAHETFHLLGLVDSYHEPSLRDNQGDLLYDCRSMGPADSVMRDTGAAHFSSVRYMRHSCSCSSVACDRSDTACLKRNSQCPKDLAAITSVPSSCPASSSASEFPATAAQPYDVATNTEEEAFFNANYAGLLNNGSHSGKYSYSFLSMETDPEPLLYPAEFRMILAPGCLNQNQVYYQCAKGAYLSSGAQGCPAKPSICNDPKLWLQ